MNPDGLNRLRYAIVKRAAQDYLEALRVTYRHNPKSSYYHRAEYMVASCETFFSRYCDYYVDVDGVKLMGELRERSRDSGFWIKGEN